MELTDFVEQIVDFDTLPPREKIRLFAWYLHVHRSVEAFDYEAICPSGTSRSKVALAPIRLLEGMATRVPAFVSTAG